MRGNIGAEAVLSLRHDEELYPRMHATPRHASFLNDNDPTEIVFRSHALALEDFAAMNLQFDANDITMISVVFEGSKRGAIIMDDISIRAASPIST